jgi:hypothetical protein
MFSSEEVVMEYKCIWQNGCAIRATWSSNNFIEKLATSQLHIVMCCYVTNQLQTHLRNSINNKYIFPFPKYELIWRIYIFILRQFIVTSTTKQHGAQVRVKIYILKHVFDIWLVAIQVRMR